MKRHYDEIDRLRGMAIGMVLLYHAIIVYPVNLHEIAWCKMLHDFLWYIEMPIFFVVSGFCFTYKGNYGMYFKKKTKRILVPHLVFAALDILPRIIPNPLVNKQVDVVESLRDLLLYGGNDWFLRVLFIVVAVFPLIDWCFKQSKVGKIGMLLVVLFLYASSESITNVMQLRMMSVYLCFFMAGYLIRGLDYEKMAKPILANVYGMWIHFFIMILFFLLINRWGENKWFSLVGSLAGTIFFYGCCTRMKGMVGRFLKICGTYSLQMYLLGGYALVLSRTIVVSIMGIQQPVAIILLNFGMDIAITIGISKWITTRGKRERE